MKSNKPRHYSNDAIRSSLVHFFLGKGVSALIAVLVLFILIRWLPVADFAAYASLHALALIIGLLSSFGINSVLLRFVPELRTKNSNLAMYRLLVLGLLSRAAIYAMIVILLLPFVPFIAKTQNMTELAWIVPWYFAVGFFRVNATFMVGALESLMWQKQAQYSVAFANIVKLVLLVAMVSSTQLGLWSIVIVEFVAEALSLTLLCMALARGWRRDPHRDLGDPNVLRHEVARYLRYGFWNYMQNLTSVLYGSAPNRLFVGHFLGVEAAAAFGVADRAIFVIRHYEPLKLLVGFIRPIMLSRFSENQDFRQLNRSTNLVLRIDWIVLLFPVLVFAIAGDTLFTWASNGKYDHVSSLFLGLYAVILVTSVVLIWDITVKAVEQTQIFTVSNLALSGSLLAALPFVGTFGVWAVIGANVVGQVVALLIVFLYMRSVGYDISLTWFLDAKLFVYAIAAIVFGHILLEQGAGIWISTVATIAGFASLLVFRPPITPEEQKSVGEFLKPALARISWLRQRTQE